MTSQQTGTLTTVIVDFRRCSSRKLGFRLLLKTIIIPYVTRRKLVGEYKSYVQKRYIRNTRQKLRFLFDHSIFWLIYSVIGWWTGYSKGATWKVKV